MVAADTSGDQKVDASDVKDGDVVLVKARAAALPYVSSRLPVYVSRRVGNVTYHPTHSSLLDRMWVS